MVKANKKQHVDRDCLSMTLERMEYLFDTFDHVAVSFSGGKDSTACLNLALQIATEKSDCRLRYLPLMRRQFRRKP